MVLILQSEATVLLTIWRIRLDDLLPARSTSHQQGPLQMEKERVDEWYYKQMELPNMQDQVYLSLS